MIRRADFRLLESAVVLFWIVAAIAGCTLAAWGIVTFARLVT